MLVSIYIYTYIKVRGKTVFYIYVYKVLTLEANSRAKDRSTAFTPINDLVDSSSTTFVEDRFPILAMVLLLFGVISLNFSR